MDKGSADSLPPSMRFETETVLSGFFDFRRVRSFFSSVFVGSCVKLGCVIAAENDASWGDLTEDHLVHQPGIEPGSHRWQRCILPLDH